VYGAVRDLLLRVLHVSPDAPSPPPGSAQAVRTFRASRRFLHYRLIGLYVGGTAFIALEFGFVLVALVQNPRVWIPAVILGAILLLVAAASYFIVRLEYEMRYYILTDRSLRIREGVWIVRESTLTFANVQNIRIAQGPLQQLFGIADVMVDTAGGGARVAEKGGEMVGGQHRGAIRGVQNAAEIRDLVLALLKRFKDAGLGDPEDARRAVAAAAPAHAVPVERLQEILAEVRALRTTLTGA